MQSVVERVLNLLIFLLETPRPATADDVRRTVAGYGEQTDEAFHRMFERDKDVLRRLGVPLKMEALDAWEVDFGYTVDPGEYALADPGLSNEEKVALSVAARMVRLGGTPSGLAALLKLGGVERGVGLEPLGADLGRGSDRLGDLFGAVTERRHIEFEYRGVMRSLDPYGLAHRRGHWYLVGAGPEGERVFRIDRIEELSVGNELGAFDKPMRFDVRKAVDTQPWEAGQDPLIEAEVEFAPEVSWWAARTLGVPDPDGPLTARVPVANHDAFVGWVLSFGEHAEVTSPEEVRAEIRERVSAAMEAMS
jgi:predicted DNA-binding transcriptional regulator YafY